MTKSDKKAAIKLCLSDLGKALGYSNQEAEYHFNEKICKKVRSKLIKRAHRSLK